MFCRPTQVQITVLLTSKKLSRRQESPKLLLVQNHRHGPRRRPEVGEGRGVKAVQFVQQKKPKPLTNKEFGLQYSSGPPTFTIERRWATILADSGGAPVSTG